MVVVGMLMGRVGMGVMEVGEVVVVLVGLVEVGASVVTLVMAVAAIVGDQD